jgi:hypothetical protein
VRTDTALILRELTKDEIFIVRSWPTAPPQAAGINGFR